MTPARVEPAGNGTLDSLTALLDAGKLPTDGLRDHLQTMLVARDAAGIIGCVPRSRRAHGVGQHSTRAALDLARQHRVAAVYLLTTSAADFFARHFGFQPIGRAEVPAAVQQSAEFVSACPQTAQAMVREVHQP
jgi:amino-acid N-acetyltransferase